MRLGPKIYKRFTTGAKINLILRVGPPKKDGFHDLETLMLPLDWGDQLDLRLTRRSAGPNKIDLVVRPRLNLPAEKNLVIRAVEAFSEAFGQYFEGRIVLHKRVPTGAGLGGGSSDAAAVLRMLAEAAGMRVRQNKRLWSIARGLGSDIPFFFESSPSWCTGRGDICKPLPRLPHWEIVLVHSPQKPVPTGWAYQELDRLRKGSRITFKGLPDYLQAGGWNIPALENDFEAVAFRRHPSLRKIKVALAQVGALAAGMSGSGSSFFGIFANGEATQRACRALRKRGFVAVACRTLSGLKNGQS